MENNIFHFENLVAYQRGLELVTHVYEVIKNFPREEQYALCDQLRRAVVSIPSNIAEGMGRFSNKEKAHYLEIAYGSTYMQLPPVEKRCTHTPIELKF